MGGALLKGWMDGGVKPGQIAVVEPDAAQRSQIQKQFGVAVHAGAAEIPARFRPGAVVLAVKPQAMAEALPPYGRFAKQDAVFLSIAAGKTIAAIKGLLGGGAVVRAMPNLPAAVGRGITVACADPSVPARQRDQCQALLAGMGEVAWVEDEGLMDAVTAVSGSGPAYVFLLVECLAEAGVAAGLEPELAMRLARATVAGSGELLHRSNEPAAALRDSVTSKGGTTAAALAVLMGTGGLGPLLKKAVAAAAARSRELSH
jgi:pyrroline-5-carboxylate reductase